MQIKEADMKHAYALFNVVVVAMKDYLEVNPEANKSSITITVTNMLMARLVEMEVFERADSEEERLKLIESHKEMAIKAIDMVKTQSTFMPEDLD